MPSERDQSVIVWLRPEQAPLVRAVVDRLGLTVVAAGSPERGRASEVAAALRGAGVAGEGAAAADVLAMDDLRSVAATCESSLLWIVDPGEFAGSAEGGAAGGAGDVEALRTCAGRGVKVATAEPMPA